ncbi:Aste57867_1784 [Aphanomyces stellatus]|uniref:Aste57867_1784 protein n=1 Tax=Aphanomyces stellatus TaxID=120398 RepID=A0A485K643_9STRA|nr:hypothetical protein As57867_001782 [Aphanomyces stellatus]VFT78993.1 Aste57867_1784 [Aphanomyces stellatus]
MFPTAIPPPRHGAWHNVLLSRDLWHYVASFQPGYLQDLVPFVHWHRLHTALAASDRLAPPMETLNALHRLLGPWFDTYGHARLALLYSVFPRMQALVVVHAAASGRLDLISGDDDSDVACPRRLVCVAAASGQLDVVEHFQSCDRRQPALPPLDLLAVAAAHGQLHVVRHMHDALANRQSVQPIRRLTTTIVPSSVLDDAAAGGHVDVVAFLHAHGYGATTAAMDRAAAQGHLDMVIFLHAHRTEGCTRAAVDGAAAAGHVHVVRWLTEHRHEGWTSDALTDAAAHGHLHVLQVLVAKRPRLGCAMHAMDLAATHGHVAVVAFLHAECGEGCTEDALVGARRNGHDDVLAYLAIHGDDIIHCICCCCGFYKPRNHYCAVLERVRRSSSDRQV